MSERKGILPLHEASRLIQSLKESLDNRDEQLLEQNASQLNRLMMVERTQGFTDEIHRVLSAYRRGDHEAARWHLDVLCELLERPQKVRGGFDLQMN